MYSKFDEPSNYINVVTNLVEHFQYCFHFWPSVLIPGTMNSSGTLNSPR